MPAGPAIAACGLAGVLAGLLTEIGAGDALAASLALPALALVVERSRLRRGLAFAMVVTVAMVIGADARTRALDPPLGRWLEAHREPGEASSAVWITGRLIEDAESTEFGVRVSVEVRWVQDAGALQAAPGVANVYVGGQRAASARSAWTAGRAVGMWVAFSDPTIALNPGGYSPRWQRLRRPYHVNGSVKSALLIDVERGAWWHEAGAAVRAHVRQAVGRCP